MNLYTSYFYQIRFFKPFMIPFSTAVWDPKWYHNFKSQSYNFIDKNGVLNGLRIKNFMPGEECDGLCTGTDPCDTLDPTKCKFLSVYRTQLQKLSKESIETYFTKVLKEIKTKMNLDKDPIPVLIVHEAPTKKCSEREIILEVMNAKGILTRELSYPIL